MALRVFLWSVAGLVAVLVLSFLMARPERLDAPTVDDVVRLFDRIAFASGENRTSHMPYIRRWTQPVRVAVIGEPEMDDADADDAGAGVPWADGVRRMAVMYDSLPNLEVAVAASAPFALQSPEMDAAKQASNFAVVMVPTADLEEFVRASDLPPVAVAALHSREGCVVLGAETPVLAQVSLLIRADLSASRRNICLGEGMAKGMGFFVSAKWANEVFRERQKTLAFHPLGRLAAALVYDPALTPGLPREEALAEARRVLAARGLEMDEDQADGGN